MKTKPPPTETVQTIPTESLLVSPLNTRKPTAKDVKELALSIKSSGQITPCIVRPGTTPGTFEIAAGARRCVACRSLKIPALCIVRDIPDDEFEDMILTENLQREDPEPLSEALLIERRLNEGASSKEIAARYGKTESWVKRRVKLLGITDESRNFLTKNTHSFNTEMLEFLGSLSPDVQKQVLDDCYLEDMRDLTALQEAVHQEKRSVDEPFLQDPRTAHNDCVIGCRENSETGLFPTGCGNCENAACFKQRRQNHFDLRITEALNSESISNIIVFRTSWTGRLTYQGNELKVLDSYEFKNRYSISKKTTPHIAIDVTDINAITTHFLKAKANNLAVGKAPANIDRFERLRGKREASTVTAILDALAIETADNLYQKHASTFPNRDQFFLSLVASFGQLVHNDFRNRENWEKTLTHGTVNTDDIWSQIKTILTKRLNYDTQKTCLNEHFLSELASLANLIQFNLAQNRIDTANAIYPKWALAEGLDPVTLSK